jgi:LPXTG-site transpeptidase (sortase) family protein
MMVSKLGTFTIVIGFILTSIGILGFYNNLGESLAFVEKAGLRNEELLGSVPVTPTPMAGGVKSRTITTTPLPTQNWAEVILSRPVLADNSPTAVTTFIEEAEVPIRLFIPAIQLDSQILLSKIQLVNSTGKTMYQQWLVPDEAAVGWNEGSSRLGESGNTVLNGHHNEYGEVFGHLVNLQIGDTIYVYGKNSLFTYLITNRMILAEREQELSVRMQNAQWIMPSTDERLTLITCWPQWTNTHRLIIVAKRVARELIAPTAYNH